MSKHILEFVITDFCNLNCPLCVQGMPLQTNKRIMPIDELREISNFIKPFEFDAIKISGGEPTLHPQFAEICKNLRKMFPARYYILATNGFGLEKFKDYVYVFDKVSITHYPGRNDRVFERAKRLGLTNLKTGVKRDYIEMRDSYRERNLNKINVYKHCKKTRIKKIIQGRIYPCCVIFGQAVRQNIDINTISAPVDENWRENLAKINIENHCKRCSVDVKIPNFWKDVLNAFPRLRQNMLHKACRDAKKHNRTI